MVLRAVVLVFALFGCAGSRPGESRDFAHDDSLWMREELYFGSDIPTGGVVTDSLWEDFVDREILSRFPAGFTTLPATGLYRYKTGEAKKELTRIVIIFVPPNHPEQSGQIEDIIEHYKTKFSQESVLRVTSRTRAKF